MHGFVEQVERLLMALLLFAVGAFVASGGLAALTWRGAAIGILLHVLIRPATGWLAQLRGPGLPTERAATAFFGPDRPATPVPPVPAPTIRCTAARGAPGSPTQTGKTMASTTPIDTPPAPPAPPDLKERPQSTGRMGDKVFVGLSRGSGILLLVLMASIAAFLSYRAAIAISKDEGNFLTTFDWNPAGDPPVFGIAVLLFGTVVSSIIAMIIAVPIAVGIALFISHYAPRKLAAPIAYVVDLLAAVPSIVYGIWGALVLVPYLEGLNLWLDQFFGW
ncbi:hypothetical protein ABZ086_36285, partial [Streptomyces halstedii]